jgi:hypothetical protein
LLDLREAVSLVQHDIVVADARHLIAAVREQTSRTRRVPHRQHEERIDAQRVGSSSLCLESASGTERPWSRRRTHAVLLARVVPPPLPHGPVVAIAQFGNLLCVKAARGVPIRVARSRNAPQA